jgi:predicted amidohydrolase YtcJ
MGTLESKEKVFYGGTIISINPKHPIVNAVGISDGKIIAVGDLEDVKSQMKEKYELIDLKGSTLLPGFYDSHMHPITFIFFLLNPDLSNIRSIEELQTYLKAISKEKKHDELLIGFNLSEENFEIPILPTRWDLDVACPDTPVFVLRYDGHIGIANSKALELAGIDENTEVPEGGEIRRNNKGELTGIISEKALNLILSKITFPSTKQVNEAAEKAFKMLAQKGLTSIHGIVSIDKSGEFGEASAIEFSLLKSIYNKILQNIYIMINTEKPKKLERLRKPPLHDDQRDAKFKINCLKLFMDGSFGAKTACMYEPFTDEPEMCGFCVIEEEEIYEKMKYAHNKGYQICIHAIGDKANRIVVDLYKRLLKEFPRKNHRHRIEHASILTADVIKDMNEYGIIASCQPPFINSEYNWLEKRLGKERCKHTYPMKSIIDGGVVLISGSDCPIEDPSPILGLHALVTRNGFVPEECLTMEEALKTYTINAAYAAFEEDMKGSIEVGKLADFVILDKNPLEVKKDQIRTIQVLETIIRGKTVYKKELE